MISSVVRAFLILILPAAEFLILRLYLKQNLDLKFGWAYFTDFDFLIPLPTAFTLAVCFLDREKRTPLNPQKNFLALNFVFLVSFVLVNIFFERAAVGDPAGLVLTWVLLATGIFITAICAFVPVTYFLSQSSSFVLIPAILVAFSTVISNRALNAWWPHFAWASTSGIRTILTSLLGNSFVALIEPRFGTRVVLRFGSFGASIGKGCGGMDAFFLFSYCYFLWITVAPKIFSKAKWFLVGLGGLFLMAGLNSMRIVLFFLVALYSHQTLGDKVSGDLFLTLFHAHAGWVLYVTGIAVYFLFAQKHFVTSASLASTPPPLPLPTCAPQA